MGSHRPRCVLPIAKAIGRTARRPDEPHCTPPTVAIVPGANRKKSSNVVVLACGGGECRRRYIREWRGNQRDSLGNRPGLSRPIANAGCRLATDTGDLNSAAVLDRQNHRYDPGEREIRPLTW